MCFVFPVLFHQHSHPRFHKGLYENPRRVVVGSIPSRVWRRNDGVNGIIIGFKEAWYVLEIGLSFAERDIV